MLHRCRFALLCTVAAANLLADATAQNLPRAHRIAGNHYVAAPELAAFYGLGRDQIPAPDRAHYLSGCCELLLRANRRDIRLNGVTHWLALPVLYARGQLWVSELDVRKTIHPILRPPRLRPTANLRTIVLDPGHGGSDHGARGSSGRPEKQLTLDLARRLQKNLTHAGFRVLLTRTADRTVPLQQRVSFAERHGAELFLSLHFNAGGTADGIETYCLPPARAASTANPSARIRAQPQRGNRHDDHNVLLAHHIQRSLLLATGATDRGVRRARFLLLREAPCPAVLVEAGFLSNRAEERKILQPQHRELLAKAIAEAIMAYKQAVQ